MTLDEQAAEEEAARRHRWKRIRTSVTLLVLVGVVIGAAWYSWRSVTEEEPTATTTSPACAPGAPTAAPKPAEIQLNVYNATDRRGLASAVARQLRDRGFSVVRIDNDPLDKTIEGTAEVRSNADQRGAAGLVAALVPGAAYLADDRSEATVDLVLGNAFAELAAAGASAPVPTDLPSCDAA